MRTSKTKAPAKKTSPPAKNKSQPVVAAKTVPASARKSVKAPPQEFKKKVAARSKPAPVVAAPKLTVVDTAPVQKTVPTKEDQKKTAPAPAPNKVRIFQIYYRPEQRPKLDPAFEPLNNEGDDSSLLEFNVFRKLMASEFVEGVELWGALSWKFTEKTGLTGRQLRQIIASNPGHDVYYCNPFPEMEGLYHNMWLQGETSHPNFLILCNEFFKAAGLDGNTFAQIQPSKDFAASNYFVATPKFWAGYLAFVNQIIARAEKGMSDTVRAMIYSSAADQKGLHAGASYMPFIIERLFGVYLKMTGGQYRNFKFVCDLPEGKQNVHIKLLKQMKDVAISSKSLWMATCWINYRNLYMQQYHGKEWCRQYLKNITPNELVF